MIKLRKVFNNYLENTSGQFGMYFALLAVPIALAVGYSIDQNQSLKSNDTMLAAMDSAALASVIPAELTNEERAAFAQEVFDKNYLGQAKVTLDIQATRERVDIAGEATTETIFGGFSRRKTTIASEKTAAVLTRSDVVCVLALDPTGENAIEFLDSAKFSSPACSVQANSTHAQALHAKVAIPPVAKSFCSAGGSKGEFFPYVKNDCTPVEDPFAHLEIPDAADSCDQRRNVTITGTNTQTGSIEVFESQLAKSATGEVLIPDSSTLSPGIYCRGLEIHGADVFLEPGVYHVWGNLKFTRFATVVGNDVTFILKGTNNRLIIEEGAQVSLKAPSEGLTAGLVFWQKYLEFWPYVRGVIPPSPNRTIARSEINSGGGLRIVGTAYLPDHELLVTSENAVASQSPATSFIARRLKFAGRTNMQVNVDHEKGGVPPILPRSDDSARLVR